MTELLLILFFFAAAAFYFGGVAFVVQENIFSGTEAELQYVLLLQFHVPCEKTQNKTALQEEAIKSRRNLHVPLSFDLLVVHERSIRRSEIDYVRFNSPP